MREIDREIRKRERNERDRKSKTEKKKCRGIRREKWERKKEILAFQL